MTNCDDMRANDSSMLVSIVVPVYNSATILPELVRRLVHVMEFEKGGYEIILVDDGSMDESWDVISQLGTKDKRVAGVRLRKNMGQWVAVLAGLSKAGGSYLITIDDDLEYHPEDIPLLYKALVSNPYKVVFGMASGKYEKQGKNSRLSHTRKKILNMFWGTPPTDSFRIFHRGTVFREGEFLPTVLLEAFMARTLTRKDYGYVEVGFSQRYWGKSNHPLSKKIGLFVRYSMHYGVWPLGYMVCVLLLVGLGMAWYGGLGANGCIWFGYGLYSVTVLALAAYILWNRGRMLGPDVIRDTVNL